MLIEAFDKVLEQVKALSANEQRRLQEALDEMLNQEARDQDQEDESTSSSITVIRFGQNNQEASFHFYRWT